MGSLDGCRVRTYSICRIWGRKKINLLGLGLVKVILVKDKGAGKDVAEEARQGRLAARRSPADPHQDRLLACHDFSPRELGAVDSNQAFRGPRSSCSLVTMARDGVLEGCTGLTVRARCRWEKENIVIRTSRAPGRA